MNWISGPLRGYVQFNIHTRVVDAIRHFHSAGVIYADRG